MYKRKSSTLDFDVKSEQSDDSMSSASSSSSDSRQTNIISNEDTIEILTNTINDPSTDDLQKKNLLRQRAFLNYQCGRWQNALDDINALEQTNLRSSLFALKIKAHIQQQSHQHRLSIVNMMENNQYTSDLEILFANICPQSVNKLLEGEYVVKNNK